MPLAPFLIGLVGSLVGRVLASLGMSVVTIVGVEAAIGAAKNMLVSSVVALPADLMNLFLLAGGGIALNLILGAISFRLTLWTIQKSVAVLGVSA